MLKTLAINLTLLCLLLAAGCNSDSNGAEVDVTGTWRAALAVDSCNPADLCSANGIIQGASANAIMVLNQDGSKIRGTYTYEGTSVLADVSGDVAGNQIILDGSVSQLLGRITVHLTGTVLNNQMQTQVMHQVNLSDGRSGSITGTGNFSRS